MRLSKWKKFFGRGKFLKTSEKDEEKNSNQLPTNVTHKSDDDDSTLEPLREDRPKENVDGLSHTTTEERMLNLSIKGNEHNRLDDCTFLVSIIKSNTFPDQEHLSKKVTLLLPCQDDGGSTERNNSSPNVTPRSDDNDSAYESLHEDQTNEADDTLTQLTDDERFLNVSIKKDKHNCLDIHKVPVSIIKSKTFPVHEHLEKRVTLMLPDKGYSASNVMYRQHVHRKHLYKLYTHQQPVSHCKVKVFTVPEKKSAQLRK